MTSEASRKILSHSKQNDRGPDYFGYYKHSALNLFYQNEDIPFSGTEIHNFSGSGSFFGDPIVEGLSNIKKEKLRMLLKQSVVCLDQEIDKIHSRISAMFQIDEALMGNELGTSDEDLEEPESSRSQRSALLGKLSKLADTSQSESFKKVYEDFQVLLHVAGLEAQDAIDKCFADALAELDLMEQNLEEYLNILASKCRTCRANNRQMTAAEKEVLGQWIHVLPGKALDRIVEIIHCRDSTKKPLPDKIHVDLEKEDNAVLWRLYFYVKTVARANNA
ncbi:hypothetical protein Taro_017569 [Colocasia esculenta]|uniref:NET domain-containing protein n=1 Tax=Colocasia esculenta TaxID=4460 RepID=A0A843UWG2_COLES|nr:hypothetical protein [Colocasia esculenta]